MSKEKQANQEKLENKAHKDQPEVMVDKVKEVSVVKQAHQVNVGKVED